MDEPEFWRWVWIIVAGALGGGEMLMPGTLFLAPFAAGAAAAAILAFASVGLLWQWLAFLVISGVAFAALRPLARRMDRDGPQLGVGANRLIGQDARVTEAIPAGDLGLVKVDREQWRAQSAEGGAVAAGATVRVVEVQGTRVVVATPTTPPPIEAPNEPADPHTP